MARMTFKAGEEYSLKLSALQSGSDEIAKRAIYEAAGLIADAVRSNLEGVLSGKSSGALSDSLGITPILQDLYGNWNARIGFDGYDAQGTPNQLKARALESGTSNITARPFVGPAVSRTRQAAQQLMGRVIDEEIQKRMR